MRPRGRKICLKGPVKGFKNLSGRAVLFQKARFVLPHATCDLVDGFINAPIHVYRFRGSVDSDVICTEEDNLGPVTPVLNVQNGLGLEICSSGPPGRPGCLTDFECIMAFPTGTNRM